MKDVFVFFLKELKKNILMKKIMFWFFFKVVNAIYVISIKFNSSFFKK